MEIDYCSRLTAVLDVVRILLLQGLAFRNHDESSSSKNKVNFLEILNWYAKRVEEVGNVINKNAPGNNQLTSPMIQKQLVNTCAAKTTLAIINEIGDSNFSLMVDESWDKSIKEQMAVILRFVNKQVLEVLQNVCQDGSVADQKGLASSLISKMENFEFVFVLHLMMKVLGIKNELSNVLQQKDQNIVNTMALVDTVKDRIQDLRDNRWDELLEEVQSFCDRMYTPVPNIEDKIPVQGRSRHEG
ncbi:uncharacterized protein LOC120260083 [Dioscorea cayenensis subsp. rotundata]|uniref:Uncharacterized protein LOC120260083 n=1 Tax=Dioscorea cayennensis subsp. rotundata TaxID=55577 RepID=A0AB40B881_DIOCR|nr:uncharacterized protein LOC120260083 [Dioscorea cayenensis subsp. rotundata]